MSRCNVLYVMSDLNRCNGITTFAMNYFRNIDTSKVKIDFVITTDDVDDEYRKEIEDRGSKIYVVEYNNDSLISNVSRIKKFIKDNAHNYDIIHSQLINKGYFYLKYAKKYGIKKRILHSHNTTLGDGNVIKQIVNQIFRYLAIKNANTYFACTDIAGKYLFGNRKFTIIKNAFDVSKFKYNEKARKQLRKELEIEDNVVMLQVGRLDYQKNPHFSLELVKKLKNEIPNIKLIFAGTGKYLDDLKRVVNEEKLSKEVMFLGLRDDISSLYSASDIFIFPSRFEGLGLVAVEAQISGLPCYLSSEVPHDSNICDKVCYLPLNDIDLWVDTIIKTYKQSDRHDGSLNAQKKHYDIASEVKNLENEYELLAGDK